MWACVCVCKPILSFQAQNLGCAPLPGEQIAFSRLPWGEKHCSSSLSLLPVTPSFSLSPLSVFLHWSILFSFGIPVTHLQHFWIEMNLFLLYSYAVAVMDINLLYLEPSVLSSRYITSSSGSAHTGGVIFSRLHMKKGIISHWLFGFYDENLSALFSKAIVFPLCADLSQMANIEGESDGWWNTMTHMVVTCWVWTAWGLSSCRLTEQVKECFFHE